MKFIRLTLKRKNRDWFVAVAHIVSITPEPDGTGSCVGVSTGFAIEVDESVTTILKAVQS